MQRKYHNNYSQNTIKYSIMCGYFWIGFVNAMLNGEKLLDHSNVFSSNEYRMII